MKKHVALLLCSVFLLALAIAAMIFIPRSPFVFTEKVLKDADMTFHSIMTYTEFVAGGPKEKTSEDVMNYATAEDEAYIKNVCLSIKKVGAAQEEDISAFNRNEAGTLRQSYFIRFTTPKGDVYDVFTPCGRDGVSDAYPYGHIHEENRETIYFYVKHGDEVMLCSAPAYIASQLWFW